MIRRPPRSTLSSSSAASDVYKRQHLGGRSVYHPRGKMLGGSSGQNAMIYIRGSRHDYDSWANGGATGWSYDDVLSLFKRSEANSRGASEYHGASGPLY